LRRIARRAAASRARKLAISQNSLSCLRGTVAPAPAADQAADLVEAERGMLIPKSLKSQ
jgi:hypothetical protein